MTQEKEDLSRITSFSEPAGEGRTPEPSLERDDSSVISFIKNLIRPKIENGSSLRETIEDYIENDNAGVEEESVTLHEKALIINVLKLHDMRATDVMVPRADIIAVSDDMTQRDLFALLSEKQYSRIPVYKDTLDQIVGAIHAKDILASLAKGEEIDLKNLIRDVPIISPAMHILDLLLQMRITRKHMVLVIDEFGGIDGLVTIGDVIEAIVGEIYDEHDPDDAAVITERGDGSFIADARVDLEEFEEIFGKILSDDERKENDTLGGLVVYLAGRIPARGEVINHTSGLLFEIAEADPRRVNRIVLRSIPKVESND